MWDGHETSKRHLVPEWGWESPITRGKSRALCGSGNGCWNGCEDNWHERRKLSYQPIGERMKRAACSDCEKLSKLSYGKWLMAYKQIIRTDVIEFMKTEIHNAMKIREEQRWVKIKRVVEG